MTRISKKQERRSQSPRKHKKPALKTGSLPDNLPLGYKEHTNAMVDGKKINAFIPKMK